MPDRDQPRIVATNTTADVARTRAMRDVSWTVRELAANLIRVVRGAGKPDDIVDHAVAFTKAMVAFQQATESWPTAHELSSALSIRKEQRRHHMRDEAETERFLAENHAIRGALQIAASRLLRQLTQEHAGDDEMDGGMRRIENLKAELRREARLAVRRAAVPKAKPKRVKA